MKTSIRIISIVLLICALVSCFVSCNLPIGSTTTTQQGGSPAELVDYVSQVKLDLASSRARQEVTIHMHIDGDTTHFNLSTPIDGSKILKARYLGVDTPESTGAIEKWGKKASNYTKEKLINATSIIIESDTHIWNTDSNGRHLVWVWYKNDSMTDYSLLNLELLQIGLAKPKGTDNVYGSYCFNAYMQARAHKLYVFGSDVDPDFYIGEAIPVDLLELATNPEKYNGKKVVFEAVITRDFGNSIYVQAYNPETDMYHAIGAYYGYNFGGMDQLQRGNLMKIVGTVSYWEAGGTYQISDLKYNPFSPKPEENIAILASGQEVVYTLTSPEEFCTGKREVIVLDDEGEEVLKEFSYAELALNTAIEMHDLVVTKVHTTVNSESSAGAMTLTCSAGGYTITVRTEVLKNEDGNLITEEFFYGKTIDVKGLVAYYNGNYQIKLISVNDVVVK